MAMNEYGRTAKRHWQQHLPDSYHQIQDPEAFFTNLGEEVSQEIEDLAQDLAGDDPPGETYMDKLGRLNMARNQARERVLAERVLLPPETEPSENEQDNDHNQN